MASKAAQKKTKTETVEADGFTFDTGLDVPPAARSAKASSETMKKLKAMPVGASFIEPVAVPDTITDEAERTKSFTEQARRVTNRLSGAVRRLRNANDGELSGRAYAMRTVNDPSGLGVGVRVWRNEDEAS